MHIPERVATPREERKNVVTPREGRNSLVSPREGRMSMTTPREEDYIAPPTFKLLDMSSRLLTPTTVRAGCVLATVLDNAVGPSYRL